FIALDESSWRIVRLVYAILASVAVIGISLNSILLLTTIKTKKLGSTSNSLIGICALFDVCHQVGYLIQFPILFSDFYIHIYMCSAMQVSLIG
ncbi:hypothetical protein PENTCL1PPCAC_17161, partial [Pristionchus entomophagus]